MNFFGSSIDFPVRSDLRGSFVTTSVPEEIVSQAIADLVETTRGERVMLPDYGINDWVFSVQDRTFITRISDELETQIKRYVPFIQKLSIVGATDELGRAVLQISYWLINEFNAPKNLVYPVWRLQQ
jgi:phage baseplate assembly protein W